LLIAHQLTPFIPSRVLPALHVGNVNAAGSNNIVIISAAVAEVARHAAANPFTAAAVYFSEHSSQRITPSEET
jgi:ribosomal protein L18E